MKMKRNLLVVLMMLAIFGWVPAAYATPCSFDLAFINEDIGPEPYVHVDVDLTDATHATILATAYDNYKMGDTDAFAVNFNGDVTISDLTFYDPKTSIVPVTPGLPSPQNANPSGYTGYLANSSHHISMWGDFGTVFSVQSFNAADNFDVITFVATKVSGTWDSCEDVLLTDFPNGIFPAVAHVQNQLTGETGFASVPLPPSAVLMGSGLLGLGLVGWRRWRTCS